MNATPGPALADPERNREPAPRAADSAANAAGENDESRRESDENFWQWVALVVLLGCWLAEAQL